MVLTLLCISCNADFEESTTSSKNKVNNIDEYIALGKLHNELLEVAENICTIAKSRSEDYPYIGNDSALFRQIHTKQLMAVEEMPISESEKMFFKASLNENIRFYQTDNVYETLNGSNNTVNILVDLHKLYMEGIIDHQEEALLKILTFAVNSNRRDGDHTKLKVTITTLCKKWENYYEDKDEKAGEFSGQILGIAKASVDWWDENSMETRALPAWIGADAAGAIIGAIHNAGTQYLVNKNVDLRQVGYHALGGAVISSTGIVKCVAVWINKIL